MAAYKAPDMLVEQGSLSIDAYRRLESVVMHSKAFYGGKKSFSSALVTFYTVLEKGTAFSKGTVLSTQARLAFNLKKVAFDHMIR